MALEKVDNAEPTLRSLLLSKSDWFEDQIMEAAKRSGYGYVTIAMNRMFAHLGQHPVGLSELARRLSVSRQAVYKLALEAEKKGLVCFVDCESDARVKKLHYTEQGKKMAKIARKNFKLIEDQLASRIGSDKVAVLIDILSMDWGGDVT